MRLLSILLAALVMLSLYALIFEREAVLEFAGAEASDAAGDDAAALTDEDVASTDSVESEPVAPADADARVAVSVVAMPSQAQRIDGSVLVRGRTEAARQVDVRAETTGKIISDPLRKGAFVEEGQLLCQLDPGTRVVSLAEAEARLTEARSRGPEAQARVAEAEARLSEAQINDNAAQSLSQDGFASDTRVATTRAAVQSARAAVEAAKAGLDGAESGVQAAEAAVAAARTEIARLKIMAPFGGLLESDTAELGALIQTGGLCATVIQLDPIKLVGFVPETEVDKVELGAEADARLATGREVTGEVTFLSRAADETTRTFRVEVEVPNSDLTIRDGQTVEIQISSDGRSAHLLPQSALTLNDEGALGVRTVEDGLARFKPVRMLRDLAEGVWVDGLDDEATIIVVGQEFVTDGVPVQATIREIGAAMDATDMDATATNAEAGQ